MKWLFVLLLLTASLHHTQAQDITALIKEGNRLEAIPDENAAFHKFREVLKHQPLNMYALCRSSELCSRIGKRQTNPKVRADYYNAAKTYAGIALKINPNDADANCVMAIALGRSSMSKSGREKVETAREIKKHLDVSLNSDPTNFKTWHIPGRWEYEIANLSGMERTIVKILYGGIPPASIKQAIIAFEKSRALQPGFLLNYLEMARAYKDDDQTQKAIYYLKHLLTLPNQTEDDPAIKEEARKYLAAWK